MKDNGENSGRGSGLFKKILKTACAAAVILIVLTAAGIYKSVLRLNTADNAAASSAQDERLSSDERKTTAPPETPSASGSTDDMSWIPAEGLAAPPGYKGKTAYFTFDDGPSMDRTPEILDILKSYGINATFFLIGQNIRAENHNIIKRAYNEGNAIGNHTNDHFSAGSSLEHFKYSVNRTSDLIEQITGKRPECFRFPGGSNCSYMKEVIKPGSAWLHDNGYEYFDWNTSTGDGNVKVTYSAEQLCANALKNANADQLIVLMHDSPIRAECAHDAAGALPLLIRALYDLGYKFDVLSRYSPAKHFS